MSCRCTEGKQHGPSKGLDPSEAVHPADRIETVEMLGGSLVAPFVASTRFAWPNSVLRARTLASQSSFLPNDRPQFFVSLSTLPSCEQEEMRNHHDSRFLRDKMDELIVLVEHCIDGKRGQESGSASVLPSLYPRHLTESERGWTGRVLTALAHKYCT